jgi:membrane-bound metal-dependent hydrolase YbcI (DUF457 family)
MPSPLGHLLAGWSVAVAASSPGETPAADAPPSRLRWYMPLALFAAFVGAAPDLDLFFSGWHRTVTHSLAMTVLLMIVTAVVTGQVTGRIHWRVVFIVGGAHATHLLLDWLGTDPTPPEGFQLLWPFDHHYFVSGWNLFPRTERRLSDPTFWSANMWAATVEIALTLPVAWASWRWATRRRKSRGRTFVPDVRQRPSV